MTHTITTALTTSLIHKYSLLLQAVQGKVGVIMAGKNQRDNMDWVMSELDLHHVKDRDVEVRILDQRFLAVIQGWALL